MKHKTIRKKLLRYLESDLPEREQREIATHLQNCQSCREDAGHLKQWWQPGRPVDRPPPPPYLWRRISERLRADETQGMPARIITALLPALRPTLTAIMLLTMIWSGIQLGNLLSPPRPQPSGISRGNLAENFGLHYFEVLPPGSLDARLLALSESEGQR